jgi:hypothetical protein
MTRPRNSLLTFSIHTYSVKTSHLYTVLFPRCNSVASHDMHVKTKVTFTGEEAFKRRLTEPEGSLPCSRDPSTGPYPEPDECSSYHNNLFISDPL